MGLYREQFIPADPPLDGCYIVWRKYEPERWNEARQILKDKTNETAT